MPYLGIDLGTTNSVATIFDERTEKIEVVKIDGIDEVLPSVVYISEDEIIVGNEAKNGAIIYPEETILSIKRKMGEKEGMELQGKTYLPEDISSYILKKLKTCAEEQKGVVFNEVVITHPAYFSDAQIYATKKAGELAGFKTVNLLSEPLSAAIEYGYKQGYAQTLLVYDLGGGTFDACVLKVQTDVYGNTSFHECSDVGDMHLGGDDMDTLLVDYMLEKFKIMSSIDINSLETSDAKRVLQKFKQEAEILKKTLSSSHKAVCKIHPLVIVEGVPHNFILEITRDEFEGLIRPLVEKSKEIVSIALERGKIKADAISKVILVGGSTLIPMVKRTVAGFVKEPYLATDPAKSVAMGAAIYNYLIHLPNSQIKVNQITRKVFGTEAVIDRETGKKALIPIIPMGEAIPTRKTDDQFEVTKGASAVRINIYQWEEENEEEKRFIGSLLLEGINEQSKLAISYSINEDNIFEVHVEDQKTGAEMQSVFDRDKTMPEILVETKEVISEDMSVVFIIDTTASMDIYIEGVKDRAIEFARILETKGIQYQLGLIGFGDLLEREKPKIYKLTDQVHKFQKNVQRLPKNCGGDLPESSLDALETGVAFLQKSKLNASTRKIFVLITDAPPHIPTESGKNVEDIVKALNNEGVTTFVVAKKDKESLAAYEPLIEKCGKYYSLNDDFTEILDSIAYSIAELVHVK